jgi:uncharacterized surface protein with fasciclin (FAS1) repeats
MVSNYAKPKTMRRLITNSIILFISFAGLLSCKQNDVFIPKDYNKIPAILADNYNLSVFSAALDRTGLDEVLQKEEGPFTALVPSDDAFRDAGINNPNELRTRSAEWIGKLTNYHLLNGIYELQQFPYLINQEIRSRGGGRLYVSRWIKGRDTILTVNGARVVLKDVPASNGRIQIINRVLEPYQQDALADAIHTNTEVTLFAEALRRAGLMELLRTKGPYTVFVPNNAAMNAEGYASIQQLRETDPQILKALCEYHITEDRRFINDYVLSTGDTGVGSQRMLNTFTVTTTLIPDPRVPGDFIGITLQGPGNVSPIEVTRRDVLSGNGVLHVLDHVLRITR